MKITHHLDEATIMSCAAGTLDDALRVVVVSHASWCVSCHGALQVAEAVGGAVLSDGGTEEVTASCKQQTFAALEAAQPVARPLPVAAGELPGPLSRLTGFTRFSDIAWKSKAPGVAMADIKILPSAVGHLYLLRIAPGKSMPEHGHGGEELTMILSGSYSDKFGTFARGDVADLDTEVEHSPVVGGEEPCICLVAAEAPTKFKSFFAKLAQPYLGI